MDNETYNHEWFRERALKTIKKISEGVWDYSDSLLLYTPGGELEYETIQHGDDPYAELITKPERVYLQKIASDIVRELPDGFDFIDLGPGTNHKEQFIFDAAKTQHKTFSYVPVDISAHYLKLAAKYASDQNIPVSPVQSSFENLPATLQGKNPRFVSLGLTFTNYNPPEILTLLKNIAGAGGYIFIDAQIRDRVDIQKISEVYARDVRAVADSKITLLGLDPQKDVASRESDDQIKMWYTLSQVTPELEALGVKPGDRLFMFQSLRYTKEAFESALQATELEYTLYDTNDAFIGALLKTK